MTRVTVKDLRAARICLRGGRFWFPRNGLSWSRFVDEGIDAQALLATGDDIVLPVIRCAEAREQAEALGVTNGRQ